MQIPVSWPAHKNNSKWIKDVNLRSDTVKLLEENVVKKLLDTSLSNGFFDMTPKAQMEAKINKQDFSKP